MKALGLLLVLIIVLACGGGGDSLAGGGGSGTEMSIEQRSAVITKVEGETSKLMNNKAITTAQRCTQIAAYMKAQPEFSDSGTTTEETAWGKFTDGRVMVVNFNRMPDWYANRPNEPYVPLRRDRAPDKVSKSTTARLFHSFGTGFGQQQDIINKMAGWLTNSDYVVQPTVEGDARLSVLRTVNGNGFFFFNTHGGSFKLGSSDKIFCLSSSTLRTNDNERLADIKADLDSFKVVYMTAPNGSHEPDGSPTVDTRYAITYLFVDQYWSFGENAVVFINACYSGYTAEVGGAGPFIEACKRKGAGAYIGWTEKAKSPTSENAPLYFVDRLTAANQQQKETPDQRPFFVTDILQDMHKKGVVPSQGADLIVSLKGTNVGLRPTIEFVQMNELTDSLYVAGTFGDQQGEVTVDGVNATIIKWENERIECRIPKTGTGSYGDVIVKANGKRSNERQLTKWSSTFSFTQTGAQTLKTVINGTIKFRQDFAQRRSTPGATIKLVDPIPVFAAPDSTCSFVCSGEERDANNKLIEKWSGSGTLPLSTTPVTGPVAAWFGDGAYDPVSGDFAFGILCGGPKVITGVQPMTTLAGGASTIRKLNTVNWTIPKQTEPGNPTFTFTEWTPFTPPRANLQYSPR